MISNKHRRRLGYILFDLLQTFINPFFGLFLSFSIIYLDSPTLWGEFVIILIWMGLGQHICGWGQSEYLIRSFSQHPAQLSRSWQSAFVARLPLLTLFLLGITIFQSDQPGFMALLAWATTAFVANSFDAFITYHQRFRDALLIEVIAALASFSFLWFAPFKLNLAVIITTLAINQLFRSFGRLFLFYQLLGPISKQLTLRPFLIGAFPFLILGFTGLIQSRTDLYLVAMLTDKSALAFYQVLINRLIEIQIIANLFLRPFLKNIYRLPVSTLKRMAGRQLLLGLFVIPIALYFIKLLLHFWYGFQVSLSLLYLGGLFAFPVFGYVFVIYWLFGQKRQNVVIIINVVAIFLNGVLNFFWIEPYGLNGALGASALTQILMGIVYWQLLKDSSR